MTDPSSPSRVPARVASAASCALEPADWRYALARRPWARDEADRPASPVPQAPAAAVGPGAPPCPECGRGPLTGWHDGWTSRGTLRPDGIGAGRYATARIACRACGGRWTVLLFR